MGDNRCSSSQRCNRNEMTAEARRELEEGLLAPYFYGAASLLDDLDKRVMVWMRDNRYIIGNLRSTDMFANLVLDNATERIFVNKYYAEIPIGAFIVRGENVLMVGELDPDKSDSEGLCRLSFEEVMEMQRQQQLEEKKRQEIVNKALKQRGMQPTADPLEDV